MGEVLVSRISDRLENLGEVKLRQMLVEIGGVIEDAERRKFKDAAICRWLDQLTDVCYNLDDLLDELLKLESSENGANSVCFSLFTSCFCFGGIDHPSRIPLHLWDELSAIYSSLDYLDLKVQSNSLISGENSFSYSESRSTSSLVDMDRVYGREADSNLIINELLSEKNQESGGPEVISVVGMGGLGKTTIAQIAYNNEDVKSYFDKRIWVCVSDDFDVNKICRNMLVCMEGGLEEGMECFHHLQTRVCETVAGKRCLLVLDDVWNEDVILWDNLRRTLDVAGVGSKILVTTRNKKVADVMGTTTLIPLGVLSDEGCWSIMSSIALHDSHRSATENGPFEELGRRLVSKCNGLPLAAKALGGVMRMKNTTQEWEDVLHSEIWAEDFEESVFSPLLLSYYQLSPVLRQCFSYCAIFPKDHIIEIDNLIKMWMSEGYFEFSRGKCKAELMGREYFLALAERSFFQDFEKDYKGQIIRCKMHDLVHDVAQYLTRDKCIIITKVAGAAQQIKPLNDKSRHATIVVEDEDTFAFPTFVVEDGDTFAFPTCYKQNLRTAVFLCSTYSTINPDVFLQLKCLRTLSLSAFWFRELPQEIGKLLHLRYLNLSDNDYLESLPESLCDLFYLETLLINRCVRLRRLPEAMDKLVNLRHLHIDECVILEKLPKGIAELASLQTLDMVTVQSCDNNEALQLADLKQLNDLAGYLRIFKCGDLPNVSQAEDLNLRYRKKIAHLNLDFGWTTKRRLKETTILEALQPHPNLETLEIRNYRSTTIFPEWMMSINLRRLVLYSCQFCVSLPPLGKLQSLESLDLFHLKRIKKVGLEFLGFETNDVKRSSFISFPKLRELSFSLFFSWKEWEGFPVLDESVTIMPSLRSLKIHSCDYLEELPNFLKMTPLQNLMVTNSKILQKNLQKVKGKEMAFSSQKTFS